MKHFIQKCTSTLLALAMTATLGISAVAAPAVYSVSVKDNTMSFLQGGKSVGSYATKDGNLTLTTDADQDFIVCYYDTKGVYSAINLSDQASLSMTGTMNSLTIAEPLNDGIAITLDANSNIGTLKVASPNTVTVSGKVTTLSVTAAAKVKITSGATVSGTSITNKSAAVTAEKGATVGKAVKAPTTTTKKPTTNTTQNTSNSGQLQLKTKPIYGNKGDSLRDLEDVLNGNVEAYDRVTKDYVDGNCEWNSSRNDLDSDGSFSFTFTPDDPSYDSVRGTIKVYVESTGGDITLHYSGGAPLGGDGVKLKDLTDALNSYVYATDDDGNDVEGKAKWDSSSNTAADSGHSYSFTFTPKSSSRYNKASGRVTLD